VIVVTSQFFALLDLFIRPIALGTNLSSKGRSKMRMHATIRKRRKAELGQLLVILLLGLPALFALFAAVSLAYGSPYSASGLWFFYLVSRNFGYIGIAVAASLTGVAIFRRTVSESVAGLMALATFTAIILLWCAVRTFPSSLW
jgi:predicted permease